MSTSVSPAATASSTTYWMAGLSTTGSISFGIALVAGRKRVPSPAAGITALVMWNAITTGYLDPMTGDVSHQKRALRAELRERRRIATSTARQRADAALTQHLVELTRSLGAQ